MLRVRLQINYQYLIILLKEIDFLCIIERKPDITFL
jgi:hypothetical protein